MSVVILGGNECMKRRYCDTCFRYGCRAKVFCKPSKDINKRIGNPDLLILFTHTISHKLMQSAMVKISADTKVVRSHTSSLASLQSILQESTG